MLRGTLRWPCRRAGPSPEFGGKTAGPIELAEFEGSSEVKEGDVGYLVVGPVAKNLIEENNVVQDSIKNMRVFFPHGWPPSDPVSYRCSRLVLPRTRQRGRTRPRFPLKRRDERRKGGERKKGAAPLSGKRLCFELPKAALPSACTHGLRKQVPCHPIGFEIPPVVASFSPWHIPEWLIRCQNLPKKRAPRTHQRHGRPECSTGMRPMGAHGLIHRLGLTVFPPRTLAAAVLPRNSAKNRSPQRLKAPA